MTNAASMLWEQIDLQGARRLTRARTHTQAFALIYGEWCSIDRWDHNMTHTHTHIHPDTHYCSKVWGHLEMSLFLKEKHKFCPFK